MSGKVGQIKGIKSKFCSKCKKIKENISQSYCRECNKIRTRLWRIKKFPIKKRTGLCKCGNKKPSKKHKYCKCCKNSYAREWRKNHPLSTEQRFKSCVRRKTLMRIERGLLIKYPCEVCGTEEKVEAHHKDYNKPYDITWLCFKHHREWHKENPNPSEIPNSSY